MRALTYCGGYDYGFRNYDAQIGRFTQLDPLTWEYPDLTPYQYSGNDPIANVDLDGLEPLTSISSGLGQVNMLNEVVVQGIRKTASVTGSFFKGLGNSVWSTLKAVKHVVTNPIQTVKGIGNAIAHPIETGKALYAHAKDTYNAFKEGDAEKRAEILGNLTGDIGQIFIGTAAANAGLKLARVSSVTKKIVKVVENTRVVKPAAKGGSHLVYEGLDAAGKVRYVGITGRDAAVRFGEHLNSGTARSLLDYRVIDGATGLSKTGARVWEQTLINQYGLQKNGGMLLNKVNSIAPKYWWQYGIK
ncbi:RHS repeat-associated core domain-containing protein [Sediminibacterium goheungense]|uniref:RHS repeat-associated core domain-containing protein n=1 Tax=Sediminibacterium goheungense TaxID=1086393 RepID=UPI001060015B|nr:RHS repeat-associated core domain-containing protein [Sediminibacterium goheungense]